jgi:hypothetical protein
MRILVTCLCEMLLCVLFSDIAFICCFVELAGGQVRVVVE